MNVLLNKVNLINLKTFHTNILFKIWLIKKCVTDNTCRFILWQNIECVKSNIWNGKYIRWKFHGKKEGPYKSWRTNEQVYEECFYKNGKKEGPYKCWWSNGQLWEESFYKNGKLEGLCKCWYDNGQLFFETFYKDGKGISRGLVKNFSS